MPTIYHRRSNTLIALDDADQVADIAFVLDIKHLAQQPHAIASVEEAGASLGYAPEDVTLVSGLVRSAQATLAAHAGPAVES